MTRNPPLMALVARRLASSLGRLGIGLAMLLSTLSAQATERVSVQLRWVPQFQFAGYYMAQKLGYYRQAGLEVELRPGGPGAMQAIEAVVNGRADFGITNSGLAAAYMDGKPVVAVAAILQQSPSVWLVRSNLAHAGLAELAGKRAMLLSGPGESVELLAPFAKVGIRPEAINMVPSSYSIESFIRGDADLFSAYLSNEPFELRRRGLDYSVINPNELGLPFYGELLFTSRAFAAAHPSAVARFRDATLKGWQAAFDDIPGTARWLQQHYAPARDLAHLVYEGEQLRALSGYQSIEVGHMSPTRWRMIAAQQRELGFGQRPMKTDEFLFGMAGNHALAWPDPVRVALFGMLVAMLLCVLHLLRGNRQLSRESEAARSRSQGRRAEELRFQFLMDVAPFPLLIYRLTDGVVVYANERALGWTATEAQTDRRLVQHWLPPLGPGMPAMDRVRDGRLLRDLEIELPGQRAAPSRWCLVTVRAIEYEGQACGFATFSDISSRKNAELELSMLNAQRGRFMADIEQLQLRMREASLRDALTGLYNRGYYDTTVDRELALSRREGRPLALLMIDADHFKAINDRHGHAGGDEVLRRLGALLQATFRSSDLACRYGGEEFVVVLHHADAVAAMAHAEMLRQRVAALETHCDGGVVQFTVSIGVAVADTPDETARDLFKRADSATYQAKQQGRNCVVMAPSALAFAQAAAAHATLPVSTMPTPNAAQARLPEGVAKS